MNQQETIVLYCAELAHKLEKKCTAWLHTATNRRQENAGYELAAAADAMYSFINNHSEIMGSDTGKAAFDEPENEDFQTEMENFWEHEAD